MSSDLTYLVDLNGRVVRTWRSAFLPSAWVYFLDNGHILRGGSDRGSSPFSGGGQGGRFQEFDLDGNLVWDFRYNDPRLPHHDVAVLPNGNLLAIAWEGKTAEEARRAGRQPSAIPTNGIWPDMLIEFEPLPPNDARIVWEWHSWDHLIQNIDPTRENYGDPATHPERIDINAGSGGFGFSRDIFHTNAVAYNPELDQILLSVPTYDEVWVIDHSTTPQQAAGHTGGRSGKGGDLLYRWGNPQAYGRGSASDQLLGFQHDARWIPQGRPGAGHMMVFSNQTPTPNGATTKVYEFVPPVDASGNYAISAPAPFGPATPLWTYSNPNLQTTNLSGAERLENGNTLISAGPQGRIFEITPAGDIVWDYWSPFSGFSGNSGSSFSLFRATRVPAGHPGLVGQNLRPLDPQPPSSPSASSGTPPVTGQCPAPMVPAPTLTSIDPVIVARGAGTPLDVKLTGTNFGPGLTLDAGSHVVVTDLQVVSSTEATAKLSVGANAALGALEVRVSTPGGTSGSLSFTIVDPFPDLSVRSSHTGNFGAGFEEAYTVTVTNVGTASAASTITVTDRLPPGLEFVSASGSGWGCSAANSVITCTSSAPLAPTESSSYALRVSAGTAASPSVSHSVSVAVDGDLNPANNTAIDETTVVTPSPVFVFAPAPLVPGQQAAVEVKVPAPFPHDVTGEIALSFASNAVIPMDDPAIQFATGGRTASFTIPANETEARFGSSLQRGSLLFQPGTVAGTITFAGTFTAGTIRREFLPASGSDTLTIPLRALSIQGIRASTEGGFAVSIQLFSAAREVTQLSLSFDTTPRVSLQCGTTEGCSAAGNVLTLDVARLFSQWFAGDSHFGGLAQLRLPLSISGAVKGTVAVTLKNSKGESNSQSFALP
jgi:uncharacterized repeat protein (TIGR01451 family)